MTATLQKTDITPSIAKYLKLAAPKLIEKLGDFHKYADDKKDVSIEFSVTNKNRIKVIKITTIFGCDDKKETNFIKWKVFTSFCKKEIKAHRRAQQKKTITMGNSITLLYQNNK